MLKWVCKEVKPSDQSEFCVRGLKFGSRSAPTDPWVKHKFIMYCIQVLRIKTKDGLLTEVTEVYSNDGSQFNVSTVAVYHRDTSAMLVGSIDRSMLYCQIKTL